MNYFQKCLRIFTMLSNAMYLILFAILIWILPRQLADRVGLNKTIEIQGWVKHYAISIQIYRSTVQFLTFAIECCYGAFPSFPFPKLKQSKRGYAHLVGISFCQLGSLGWAFILLFGKTNLAFHLLPPLFKYCLCMQISFLSFDISLLTRKNYEFSLVRVYLVYRRNFPCHVR